MAQLTETELNALIAACDTQLSELVSSGMVGISSSGGGGLSVSGDAIRAIMDLRKHYVEMRDSLPSGSMLTLGYEEDSTTGADLTEFHDDGA